MAQYQYQARDGHGELAIGVVDAASLEEAGRQLRGEGKFIVKISPVSAADLVDQPVSVQSHAKRVKRKQVIFFTHQMAVMIETGVSLTDALQSTAEQMAEPHFRAVLDDVTLSVQAGGEFSAALRKHPNVFPPVMTSLLRAGEVSGTMPLMLERISQYLSKEYQTMKQARGAMMYPMFMALMAVGVTIFLLAFVLPRFAGIFESRGAALPLPTQLLLAISGCLVGYWYYWVGLALAGTLGLWWSQKTVRGIRYRDWLKLNVPLVGRLYQQLYLTRACRTMGTMINAGVSMLDMISIVRHVTNNVYFDELWDEVDSRLRQGSQLSEPMFASILIPRSIGQMIYNGEKSGQLGKVMGRIAEFTESEFDQAVHSVTAMIEPIMVVLMGSMIGFVAISLLLPIFTVSKVIAGN